MSHLTQELLIALGMVALSVVVHMLGLTNLLRLTRLHLRRFRTPWLKVDRMLIPLGLVLGLFSLHGVEVWAYALLFEAVGASRGLEHALYVSLSSYSTADVPSVNPWRMLIAAESLNGMLLIGWSTAFLFENLHRILDPEGQSLPAGAISRASSRSRRSGRGAPSGTNSSDTELMQ